MKLFLIKVIGSPRPMSWYARLVGEQFYCEDSRPYVDEGCYYLALRSLGDPTYMGQHYIDPEDCEVIEEFDGRVIPTNTVDIIRSEPE